MKKTLALTVALAVLSIGGLAFAHGWGDGYGGGPGYCNGPGNGGGPGVMPSFAETEEGKKFLKETTELRKTIHGKKFELMEAYRAGDDKKAEALEKELDELRIKLSEMAKQSGIDKYNKKRGPGYCGGPGNCGGPGYRR